MLYSIAGAAKALTEEGRPISARTLCRAVTRSKMQTAMVGASRAITLEQARAALAYAYDQPGNPNMKHQSSTT